MVTKKNIVASGSRKEAIARAHLKPGKGKVTVNGHALQGIQDTLYKAKLQEVLTLAGEVLSKVDISIKVTGGGPNSQMEACRLAAARALIQFQSTLKKLFLDYDRQFLVADVRYREKRKPNTRGNARAKRQKSYR